jgi:hypothetical protein
MFIILVVEKTRKVKMKTHGLQHVLPDHLNNYQPDAQEFYKTSCAFLQFTNIEINYLCTFSDGTVWLLVNNFR